jgi:hypothetical protein
MDHEPTRYHSHAGYVLNHAQTWPIDPVVTVYLEARAEQTSLVMTQMPAPPAIPPALHFNKIKREHGFKQDRTLGSQDDSVNTPSDCGIQVRIEQSVVLDTELEGGGELLERGVYTSPKSAWDRGYTV